VIDERSKPVTEPLAQARPFVERCLSWSGLVPLPALLVVHLATELGYAFADDVSEVVREPPSLLRLCVTVLFVWTPLTVHLVLGAWTLAFGRRAAAPGGANPVRGWGWLSKACAAVSGVFVLYHLRSYPLAAWLGEADPRDAGFRLIAELSSTRFGWPLGGGAYLIGLAATATHLGMAGHRALESEGLLHNLERRKASARACAAFGSAVFVVGAMVVIRVASGVLLR